jgi:hypothetical protein
MFNKEMKMYNPPKKALTAAQVTVLCVVAIVATSALIAGASTFGDDSRLFKWVGAALALGSAVAVFILIPTSLSDRRFVPIVFTLAAIGLGSIGYLMMNRSPLLSDILFAVAIALVLFFRFYRGPFISK